MRLKVESILVWMLTVASFSGLQGGKYFLHNRVQELGIVLAIMLFIYGALLAGFRMRKGQWWLWVSTIPILVFVIMITWSMVFALHAEVSLLPSLFASREFLLLFLAPSIYFLHLSGVSIQRLIHAILLGAILTLFSYLLFYFKIDMPSAYIDVGSYEHHLVTYDEARGFRLKPPTYAVIMVALVSVFTLFSSVGSKAKIFAFIWLCLCAYIWSLVQLRAVAAGVLVGLILFMIFLRRPSKTTGVIALAPLIILTLVITSSMLLDLMLLSHGAEVRLASFRLALEQFSEHWLLGWGQSSGYSKTYQDLFGPKFFPSDLGIIGILFKYGLIGGLLYLFACIGLLLKTLKTYWLVRYVDPAISPIFCALLVFTTMMTINMVLWPGLAYGQGLTMAAFIIGLSACVKQAVSSTYCEDPSPFIQPELRMGSQHD